MDHIIDGVLRFQRDVYPNEEALFRELSLGQTPSVLFIGCAGLAGSAAGCGGDI